MKTLEIIFMAPGPGIRRGQLLPKSDNHWARRSSYRTGSRCATELGFDVPGLERVSDWTTGGTRRRKSPGPAGSHRVRAGAPDTVARGMKIHHCFRPALPVMAEIDAVIAAQPEDIFRNAPESDAWWYTEIASFGWSSRMCCRAPFSACNSNPSRSILMKATGCEIHSSIETASTVIDPAALTELADPALGSKANVPLTSETPIGIKDRFSNPCRRTRALRIGWAGFEQVDLPVLRIPRT